MIFEYKMRYLYLLKENKQKISGFFIKMKMVENENFLNPFM